MCVAHSWHSQLASLRATNGCSPHGVHGRLVTRIYSHTFQTNLLSGTHLLWWVEKLVAESTLELSTCNGLHRAAAFKHMPLSVPPAAAALTGSTAAGDTSGMELMQGGVLKVSQRAHALNSVF